MKYLLLIMNGLEVSDGIFTEYAVTRGFVSEANVVMESFVNNGDFFVLKVLGVLVCSLVLWLIYKRFPKTILTVTSGIVIFYAAVMIWNVSIFSAGYFQYCTLM